MELTEGILISLASCKTKENAKQLINNVLITTINHFEELDFVFEKDSTQLKGGQRIPSDQADFVYFLEDLEYINAILNEQPYTRTGNIDSIGRVNYNVEEYFRTLRLKIDAIIQKLVG